MTLAAIMTKIQNKVDAVASEETDRIAFQLCGIRCRISKREIPAAGGSCVLIEYRTLGWHSIRSAAHLAEHIHRFQY